MKRLFLLMLAVLLLAGCTGKGSSDTDTQPATAQTAPKGVHLADHETQQATSGAVQVYDITGTQMYAVSDGIAVLDDNQRLTVIDPQEGLILDTAPHIGQLLAVGESCVYYLGDGICCYDYQQERTTGWTLPENVQGDFAIGTETGEIYYCAEGGIYALNMETGLARLMKKHSYQSQTILGAYFGGSVIGWKTEAGIAYLSTVDGSEIVWERGISRLYTEGEGYLAFRLDGIVEQVIAGTRGEEPLLMTLPKEELMPALTMNGLVQIQSADGLSLSFIDLSTGMKTAAVTIPGETACKAVAARNGFVWIMTENLLYRWEIALSGVTEEAVYAGPVYTARNPDPEGMAACESRVSQMNQDYGVRIRIGLDAVSQPGNNTLIAEHQIVAINQMLDELEPLLAVYPKNFLRKTVESGWIRICLVRQVNGQSGYVRYWVDGDCYVAIALGAPMEEAFLIGLGGAVDSHILGNSRDLEYWDTLNPEGFMYYYDGQMPEEYSQYAGEYFADAEAMTYPSEDRARIFYYAMTEGGEELFQKPVMQQKLKTFCEGIREAYNLTRVTDAFLWEQYLEESLAYVK